MTTYVAFLRAINVAGHASVGMDALKRAFDRAGCVAARTWIQSGNVVFECGDDHAADLFPRVEKQVLAQVGGPTTIVYRSLDHLERLVRANPFRVVPNGSDRKLYVTFLAEAPRKRMPFPIVSVPEALEALALRRLDVLVVSGRKKSGFYGFPNNFIEKALGVAGTSRNWSTVTKIVAFAR